MKKIRGFTMIELLIVIAVLGVLAVAVLAAINPIEQINRGRDTGSRSDAEQLLSAVDRYNAAQMLWPWQDTDADEASILQTDPPTAVSDTFPTGTTCSMLENLASDPDDATCPGADEIKGSFVERIIADNYNDLFMSFTSGPGNSVYVCFNPQSGSFAQEADRRCDPAATRPSDYPGWACGTCPDSSVGEHTNCICLP